MNKRDGRRKDENIRLSKRKDNKSFVVEHFQDHRDVYRKEQYKHFKTRKWSILRYTKRKRQKNVMKETKLFKAVYGSEAMVENTFINTEIRKERDEKRKGNYR